MSKASNATDSAIHRSGLGIPKRLGHIWIGPYNPPLDWMQSWKEHHPDWEYVLYDNDYLQSSNFRTRAQIDEYWRRGDFAGVSDLMRYEILLKNGGFIPEADSVCLRPADELFPAPRAYTVYENEFVRGKLVSPILACEPQNPFLEAIVSHMEGLDPATMAEPWRATGNLAIAKLIRSHTPDITVFPSHYFIPRHPDGEAYEGDGPIYAQQLFGTTRKAYSAPFLTRLQWKIRTRFHKTLTRKRRKKQRNAAYDQDMKS